MVLLAGRAGPGAGVEFGAPPPAPEPLAGSHLCPGSVSWQNVSPQGGSPFLPRLLSCFPWPPSWGGGAGWEDLKMLGESPEGSLGSVHDWLPRG